MDDTKIKEAFTRAKQDIEELRSYIVYLAEQLEEIKRTLRQTDRPTNIPTHTPQIPTDNYLAPTHTSTDSRTPTDILPLKALKSSDNNISTGNEGVPTDRQTDRQTDQHTQNKPEIGKNTLDNAVEILSSLDDLKKEVRLKFKRLTEQEILVFSTIYQFDEEVGYSDYKSLSQRLNLTESSIRDYVGRLIKKGIPIEKNKINNKQIQLNISANLKKIATLNTILQLRDL